MRSILTHFLRDLESANPDRAYKIIVGRKCIEFTIMCDRGKGRCMDIEIERKDEMMRVWTKVSNEKEGPGLDGWRPSDREEFHVESIRARG